MPRKKKPKPTIIIHHEPLPGQLPLPLERRRELMLPACPTLSLPETPRPDDFRPTIVIP